MQSPTRSLVDNEEMLLWAAAASASRQGEPRSEGRIREESTEIEAGPLHEPIPQRMEIRGRQVIGACCPAEGDCFQATRTECEASGGTFHGGPCDPDPCGCPSAGLLCDSTEANRSKCGYPAFTGSKYFLSVEKHQRGDATYDFPCVNNCIEHDAYSFERTFTNHVDPDTCEQAENDDCESDLGGSAEQTFTNCAEGPPCAREDCSETGFDVCTTRQEQVPLICGVTVSKGICTTTFLTESEKDETCHITDPFGVSHWFQETIYTDEYLTADLITRTIDGLPAYPGEFATDCCADEIGEAFRCGALYDLSEDETNFTIRRCQYKFSLSAPACNGMVVSWVERFIPDDGDPVDTPKSWTADGGETETDVFVMDDPTANGYTIISDIDVDCSECEE